MPTINRHRTWCKTCNDWTLHQHRDFEQKGNLVCKICNTEFVSVMFFEIPEEKLQEQRARYKKSKHEKIGNTFKKYLGMAMGASFPLDMSGFDMRPPGSDVRITEEDAGQIEIDEKIKLRYKEAEEMTKQLKQLYLNEFKGVGRNEICPCGSGSKYKKCCLEKFKNII